MPKLPKVQKRNMNKLEKVMCEVLIYLCLLLKENTDKGEPGPKRQLPLFAEFVMVMVRLRLGLLQRQIADIFGISQSSVSKIFYNMDNHVISCVQTSTGNVAI